MGLFQNAYQTYENFEKEEAGRYREDMEPLAPVGHITTRPDIEVTIDSSGKYVASIAEEKNASKVIIPVTEESSGRTSKPSPHPLCDQIQYVARFRDGSNKEKYDQYLEQLESWVESEYSSPKIAAVYQYVAGGTILEDLKGSGTLKLKDGIPADKNALVIWRVLGDWEEPCLWKDRELMDLYTQYYQSRISDARHGICYVTGKDLPLARQHLKGVSSAAGNAKLVSTNYDFNYTGRFDYAREAMSMSYEASQKAHNALKWLVANQGSTIGGREFLCWSPQNGRMPDIDNEVLRSLKKLIPDAINLPEDGIKNEYDYRTQLTYALNGYRSSLKEHVTDSQTVVVSFDAPVPGRLSVTLYSELPTETFLTKLENWDTHCLWYNGRSVMSPALDRIARYAYGTERNGKVEIRDKVLRNTVERLVYCRLDESHFPADIEQKLVENTSNLQVYSDENRRVLLSITCAVIKKFYHDNKKEEISMELEEEKTDRSYQFGRLLAIYEKIEQDTYDKETKREANAVRIQSAYCKQPVRYARQLDEMMKQAYFPKLSVGSRNYYKKLIGDIWSIICSQYPKESWNRPLEDTYVIGYYLQRRSMYMSKKDKEQIEEKEEEQNVNSTEE